MLSLTASLPLSISYGIQADTIENKFICLFEELLAGLKQGLSSVTFFVDVFPPREYNHANSFTHTGTHPRCDTVVRYLPSWFPGVQFHRFAKKVKEDAHNAMHLPFESVVDVLKVGAVAIMAIDSSANFGSQSGGNTYPSIVSTCLEDSEDPSKGEIDKEVIVTIAGMVYIGGYPGIVGPLDLFLAFLIGMSETVRVAAAPIAWMFLTFCRQTPR